MDNDKVISLERSTIQSLDSIKKIHPKGFDYWLARELQNLLGYTKWDNFENAINKAKMACESVGNNADNHFADIRKMVSIGSGTKRTIDNVALTVSA